MATTIGSLVLKISSSAAGVATGMKQAVGYVGAGAAKINNVLRNTFTGAGGMLARTLTGGNPFDMLYESARNLVGAIPYIGGFASAGIGLVEGFTKKLKSVIDEILDVRRTAIKLGTDTQTMGEILFAAGGDAEAVVKSLEKFQHKLGDAASGSMSASAEFRRLGLDADHLAGLGLRDSLLEISDQFNRIASPAQRAHFAMTLFGKGGAEMVPMLAKGRKGIEALMTKATALGLTFNDTQAAAAAAAKKGLKEFDGILKGIWTQVALEGVPILMQLQEELKGVSGDAITVSKSIRGVVEFLVRGGIETANAWGKVEAVFGFVKLGVQTLTLAFGKLLRYIFEGIDALTPGETAGFNAVIERMKQTEDEIMDAMRNTAGQIHADLIGTDADAAIAKIREFFDNVDKRKRDMNKTPGFFEGLADKLSKVNLANFDLMEKARERLDSMKSPFAKWQEDMQELNRWLQIGVITADQFNLLAGHSTDELLKQQKAMDRKPPEAIVQGTAAAYSAINAFRRGDGQSGNPLEAIKNLIAKEKAEAEKTARNTKDIADLLKSGQLFKVLED